MTPTTSAPSWRRWLSLWGFDVFEARSGREAVQMATQTHPSLILMDLWMPVLDGVAATEQLKRDPTTAAIPVIGVTAQTHEPWRSRALQAGAEVVLPKPLDAELDQMRQVLHRFRPQ
jgi:CheY-like chemotaxis protein